ncbi:SGNH hydrolase-type esterase domain-containing protein [Aspergillus varians]
MRRAHSVSSTSTLRSKPYLTLIALLAFLTTVLSTSTTSPYIENPPNEPRATKSFMLRVLPLGASITVGYKSTDGNGYRKPLREQLRYAGWEVDMVGRLANGTMKDNQNEGHYGDTIEQVAKAAMRSAVMQPNLILINVGTNDGIRNVHITNAGQRIDRLITELFASIPNTTIILSTLIPNARVQRVIQRLNKEYREVAARRRKQGDRVVLAEMAYFLNVDQLVDGTHPDDQGYREMAAVWWAAIQQAEEEGMLGRPNGVAKSAISLLSEVNMTSNANALDDGPVEDPLLPAYVAPAQPGEGSGVGAYGLLGRGMWVMFGIQVLCKFVGFL